MTGILVLILRILLAGCLYAFLGYAIYTIWREFQLTSQLISIRKVPVLTIQSLDIGLEGVREFNTQEITLGRDPHCDFSIQDDTISANHARLSYHHHQWWIEDLGSTNGTFLNGDMVTTPTVVISGDKIRCGKVDLLIRIKETQYH